jgi:ABC-type glycerol-3-phosphate transport system permease component
LRLGLLGLIAAASLLPLLYMIGLSAHGPAVEDGAPVWLGPWIRLGRSTPLFARWFANSAFVAILTVGFHLIADCCAGYMLAKREFRGRTMVFILVIAAMMVPRQVTLIPLFLNMSRWGLADTYAGLLLPGFGDVIGVFLFRQYLLSLPDGLLEAARIDGASQAAVLRHIVFPLAKPVLAVLAVLSFQHYWSDFFWPLVIMHDQEHFTVQVGLAYMVQSEFGRDLPLLAAGACAAAVPVLAVFLGFRGVFFEGARAGALK